MRKAFLSLCGSFLIGCAVLSCWGQSTSPAVKDQNAQSPVSKLATERADVTKLDLVILTARIRLLEQTLAHPEQRNESVVGMYYDKTSGRVIIKSWMDPRWTAAASLKTAKKELTEQATKYSVDGLLMGIAELPDGVFYMAMAGPETPVQSFCQVDFFTWKTNAKGKVEPKDVAVFEDGKLCLR